MIVPEEYHHRYDTITNSNIFKLKHWYTYPKEQETIDFVEWYFKNTLNIEFDEHKKCFRVLRFSAPPISNRWGDENTKREMTVFQKAMQPEARQKQKEYWENYWEQKNGPKQTEEIIDDLSLF